MDVASFRKRLFGGEIDFIVYDMPLDGAREIVDGAYAEGLRLQKIFSLYDPESELSLLNRDRVRAVSGELLGVLERALSVSRQTGGSYDVSLGKYAIMKKRGEVAAPKCSFRDVSINGSEVSLTHPDVLLDLGSVAKGFIGDRLSDYLIKQGACEYLIDARGDIIVGGVKTHVLGIENPRGDGSIASIKLKNQAVATSGDYRQYSGGYELSHIVNQKDAASVTVVADTLEEADLYATAFFTLPLYGQENIIKSNPQIMVLVVGSDGSALMFNDFRQLLYTW